METLHRYVTAANWRLAFSILCAILIGLPLTGCLGIAFSPEIAAQQAVTGHNPDGTKVDPASVQVLQQLPMDQDRLVLISFQETTPNGPMSCLFLYQVTRSPVGGWFAGSGGGSCTGENPDPANMPISIGGSSSGGDQPNEPGYSTVSGQVFADEIQKVQVTWADGVQQQVEVVNHSYMTYRARESQWQVIEALNGDGDVVYSSQSETAPEKE